MATRWGIIATGNISNDFTANLKILPSEEHQVVAVAGSSKAKAEKFAATFGIPRAYGSYEELAVDKDVEVVYIGAVHFLHFPIAKNLMEKGKHVLCELPLGVNADEAEQLFQIAKKNKVFLMEALYMAFLPMYVKLREELKNGTIGKVQQVIVTSSYKIGELDAWADPKTGGALLAIGYPGLFFMTQVFGNRPPDSYNISGVLNSRKSDSCASCIFNYGDGAIATLSYSILQYQNNEAYVYGTNGTVKFSDPYWFGFKMYMNDVEYASNLPLEGYKLMYHIDAAMSKQAEHVRECLKKGLLESPVVPESVTLFLLQWADLLRTELGIKFK